MQPNTLPELLSVDPRYLEPLVMRLRNHKASDDEAKQPDTKEASLNYFREMSTEDRPYDLVKTVAVLRLRGYLAKRGWWCDTGFDRFSDLVRFAAEDFAVDTILIDCDSPGGSVYGCPDCSDVIFAARKHKRIITVVNDLCASAALWVGSAAHEIVVTQSADIGSIGVYQMRIDVTEMLAKEGINVKIVRAGEQKAWGSPYLPMTADEEKVMQAEVDSIYQTFIDAVARNRGVDPGRVRSDWADARIFNGQEAVNIGLADRVASFDQVLAELVGRPVITGDQNDGQASPDWNQLTRHRRWSGSVRRRR
jgi:signal peptide peptidase SppA